MAWERKLLKRIAGGQSAAFGRFFEAYGELLYSRVLMPKLCDPMAAEDALSETFRTGFERLGQYQVQSSSIYFWLARIASNKAMDMHRARSVTGRALTSLEEQLVTVLEGPLTPSEVLDGKAFHRALRQKLAASLEAIQPRYKRAVELRFFEELDRERCAEELKVRVGTFDVLLLRALKALRREFEIHGQARSDDVAG